MHCFGACDAYDGTNLSRELHEYTYRSYMYMYLWVGADNALHQSSLGVYNLCHHLPETPSCVTFVS